MLLLFKEPCFEHLDEKRRGQLLVVTPVRVFNGKYQSEVAGMVLVDASHEDQMERMPSNIRKSNEAAAKAARIQLKLAPLLLRLGVMRMMIRNMYAETGASRDILNELHYLNLQTIINSLNPLRPS